MGVEIVRFPNTLAVGKSGGAPDLEVEKVTLYLFFGPEQIACNITSDWNQSLYSARIFVNNPIFSNI